MLRSHNIPSISDPSSTGVSSRIHLYRKEVAEINIRA
jgi:hypothetical protein